MRGRLSGKVALITGSASGLGAASVRLFAAHGAQVVIADILDDDGERLAHEIGSAAHYVRCDVTSEDSQREAIERAVHHYGKLDVLFANAGGGGTMEPIETMPVDGWDATMNLMTRGAMLGIKHAAAHLRSAGGGSVIITASIAGMRPGISSVAYSVAKAAIIHLVQMAAVEFGPDRIRVNAISPGIIPTPGVGGFFGVARDKVGAMLGEVAGIFDDAQPIPQSGTPDDVAAMALFLASDESRWVSGQNFVTDGAMMMMGPASLDPARTDGVMQKTATLAQKFQD